MPVLVIVLSLFSAASAWREGQLVAAQMQRDGLDVATSLAVLVDHHDEAQAQAELVMINAELAHLQVALTDVRPMQRPNEVESAVAVSLADGLPRWVVVTESLQERDAFVRRTLFVDLVGGLVASLVAFAVAAAVGRSLVQQRVRRLIQHLQTVGLGKYPDIDVQMGDDELGTLADAMGVMTHQLRDARADALRSAEDQRRLELQLRRADRLSAVGRTVAVFAHEVGTPLNVVVGRAERLCRAAHPESVRKDARIIAEQGARIADFVRRLLDYSRHDDGFEMVPVDLHEAVSRAVALVADRANGLHVTLDWKSRSHQLRCLGDPRALQQVVSNLLVNAAQASPLDGVVTVSLLQCACEQGTHRGLSSPHLHVVVEDQGLGIAPELKERVFTPFFTTKGPDEGTGLGLSIVEELVQDLGGLVTLEDAIGGGCRMVVHLPSLEASHG